MAAGLKVKALRSSSAGNAIVVYGEEAPPVLLDCGLPFKQLSRELWQQGFAVSQLAGCLVTHCHSDHSKAAGALMAAGVDVYCSAETAQVLSLGGHRLHTIEPELKFGLNSWRVMPLKAIHDSPGPLNFYMAAGPDRLVYITDTAYSPYRFAGLTHIIIECNYSAEILQKHFDDGIMDSRAVNRIMDTHMGLDTVRDFLRANDLSQVRGIWLAHLSNGNSNEKDFKRYIAGLTGRPVYVINS